MESTDMYILLGVIFIVLLQGLWIFQDARKRGLRYWLWGLFGCLSVPASLIIYLLVTRANKALCPRCEKKISKDYLICPYCRIELKMNTK